MALAGVLTAFAITRLPGGGGHVPADGLATGGSPARPIDDWLGLHNDAVMAVLFVVLGAVLIAKGLRPLTK